MQPDKENINVNIIPTKQLKPLLASRLAKEIIQEKKFKVVKRNVIEEFVTKKLVPTTQIQESMDVNAISRRKGYSAIQNPMSSVLDSHKIRGTLLPTPTDVWRVGDNLNTEVMEYIGKPYHILEEYIGASGKI